jgi:hypothetical protein
MSRRSSTTSQRSAVEVYHKVEAHMAPTTPRTTYKGLPTGVRKVKKQAGGGRGSRTYKAPYYSVACSACKHAYKTSGTKNVPPCPKCNTPHTGAWL